MVQLLLCHEAQRKPVLLEETPQFTQYLSIIMWLTKYISLIVARMRKRVINASQKEGVNSMQLVALKACRLPEVHHYHESRELRKAVVGEEWMTMMTPSHSLLQGSDLAKTSARKGLVVNEICWRVDGEDPVGQRTCCLEQGL